ncbi:hypothetical protein TWF694_002200 [Orbilia ellipsospora]|uniref:Uncharacterized protein n=1 Tax=Orbilia ellipsospora TaxID=2528407 RepID=A0AAV9X291_9PEZI
MAQRHPSIPNISRVGDGNRQRVQQGTHSDRRILSRTQLFIENLPAVVDEAKLRKRFEVFGHLESTSFLIGIEPRVGVCLYSYDDDALAAFQGMNKTSFEGNTLRVFLAAATETYQEARLASVPPFSEDNLSSDYLDGATSGQENPRSQMCDYQDPNTGHICGESFSSTQGLMRHWRNHNWGYRSWKCEKDISCIYSKRGFVTESERERHHSTAHTVTDTRPYKCPVPTCHYHKKGFETLNAQSLHEKVHSLGFEEHLCTVPGCGFESTQNEDIRYHLEDIHGIIGNTPSNYSNHVQDVGSHSARAQRRDITNPRRKRPSQLSRPDEKSNLDERVFASTDAEKPGVSQTHLESRVDYRPFKCQVRGCKFVKEGFETQQELLSHEDQEHDGQRGILSLVSEIPGSNVSNRPAPILTNQISFDNEVDYPPKSPTAEFLQCNNVECSEVFALEQDWRKHAMNCTLRSSSKQCSFTDCQAKFDTVPALSSHEFGSHGIRICSSLTCNRAFHQLEDAESHMRDLHSNLYNAGRRPRLAFIASVPSWNEDISETGFPYDPYRCALLNISQDKPPAMKSYTPRHQSSKKGKEIIRETLDPLPSTGASSLSTGKPNTLTQNTTGGSDSLFSETLPRYSVIMLESQPENSASRPGTQTVSPSSHAGLSEAIPKIPALKPKTPLVIDSVTQPSPQPLQLEPTTKAKYVPHDDRNPLYRYNSDGSRYVTGAVVLSPDKHQVLVLRSKDESKGILYQLPSGFLEFNDQNMEASALRECWQNAGIVGRILRTIEPAPAEEPDENGLADWHSYFEVEVEKEKERWPRYQAWHRRWLNYREARVVLSSQPDAIRALERSTIFKRGSSNMRTDNSESHLSSQSIAIPPLQKSIKSPEGTRPRRRQYPDERPPSIRKYNTVSPATDNIAAWRKDILPWLRRNFSTVMGKNRHGAIELLRVRNRPTICITCSDPRELVLDTFAEVVSGLFPMHVKVGLLARSSGIGADLARSDQLLGVSNGDGAGYTDGLRPNPKDVIDEPPHFHASKSLAAQPAEPATAGTGIGPRPEKAFRPPPIFGKYFGRPSCGATVGTVRDDDNSISAGTFGGVVVLVKHDGTEAPYGLISHHVIEEKTEDTELGIGVDEGWLVNSAGAHRFPIQQPARMDLEEAKDSLDMQRYYCDREKRYCDVDDGRAVRAKLALLDGLDQQAVDFGHVVYSSGYGFDANRHQMDWALIGEIPSWRLEDNVVPGVENFYDLHYDGSPKAPYPVEKSFFSFLSETFEQEYSVDLSEIDPLRRIHGVGSYSGIMDGIVSSETAFFRLDGMDSEEWFFTPRYNGGLGVKGDSGTWIFDDFGKVVGQIIAYNYRTDTAYFTRMDYLFEHIKSKTKAVEVYIPYKGELSKWKTEDASKQVDNAPAGSVTDASSSYVDSSFGTTKTSDTDITSPLVISDSGLGWAGFRKQ